jgi:hypothetical protein
MMLHSCSGGSVSGDGMETGSFLTASVVIDGTVDACEDTALFATVTFNNQNLPVPGVPQDPANPQPGEVGTARHITIDRYTIEYIPIDPLSPPLSRREYFQTLQLPPNSSSSFTDIQFLDINTKQEFRSFTSNNPGITNGRYSVVYRFRGHNDVGEEASVTATGSFHMSANCQ